MNKRAFAVAALAALSPVQLTAPQPPAPVTETAHITGILLGQEFRTVDIPLGSGSSYSFTTTDAYLKIQVSRSDHTSFDILLGPDPDTGGAASGYVYGSPSLELYVLQGVAYFAGTRPYGGTTGGAATSDGSIFVIQKRAAGVDRFAFLDKQAAATYLRVSNRLATPTVADITYVERYRDVTSSGNILPEVNFQDVPAKDPFGRFLVRLIDLAKAAELPRPAGW